MDQPEVNQNITPGPLPERAPPPSPETGSPQPSPEVARQTPERGKEQLANPEQRGPSQAVSLPPVQPPALPADGHAPAPPASSATTTIDTPLIADDVDVIEMEWVNKAKKIIKDTKDDPHAQETAVEQLQIDYLKKRYGKEIKPSRSG